MGSIRSSVRWATVANRSSQVAFGRRRKQHGGRRWLGESDTRYLLDSDGDGDDVYTDVQFTTLDFWRRRRSCLQPCIISVQTVKGFHAETVHASNLTTNQSKGKYAGHASNL